MHIPDSFVQHTACGSVAVRVARHPISLPQQFMVPYEGSDPLVHADFPDGFSPSYGSGIAFKEKLADGTLMFYCLTDRGPNGDGPRVPAPGGQGTMDSKIFPAPGFRPALGILRIDAAGAALVDSVPLRMSPSLPASGLPLPPGALGNSAEMPLHDTLRFDGGGPAVFHTGGIDSEAIAYDARRGVLWITDEYGPFLMQFDPASGLLRKRFAPGAGLPSILAQRRANRGMEGMTLDPASDRIHAFLQSPLSDGGKEVERYARFLRWVEFDPERGATVRMLAYPLEPSSFANGRTGHAKLGDVVALGPETFIVIEQGDGAHGGIFNHLMLVEINGATDINQANFHPDSADLEHSSISGQPHNGARYDQVTPMKKTLLLDLNAIGWTAEKAEGLALVDERTLAMTNDSDFGMKTRVYAAGGSALDADVTQFVVDSAGRITEGAAPGTVVRVARGAHEEGILSVWLLRFEQPLLAYAA